MSDEMKQEAVPAPAVDPMDERLARLERMIEDAHERLDELPTLGHRARKE